MAKQYPRADLQLLEKNFPEKLRALGQWVCWVLHQNPTRPKPDKILVDPKPRPLRPGREASHADPSTWATFDEAAAFFRLNAAISYKGKKVPVCGLGFVFSAEDTYTGVDIDDCRDPQTGKLIDEAAVIIKTLDSYAEASPSGTGAHVIVEARLPLGTSGRRRSRVEMYSELRYFTATGAILEGCPRDVEARQAELDSIYEIIFGSQSPPPPPNQQRRDVAPDEAKLARVRAMSDEQLLEKARAAANGVKFIELWEGRGVADHSQADASLCAILAYWTRCDHERIDKLFRRSALMRPKWDQRRGTQTYGERTVQFAVCGSTSVYDPDLDATVAATRNDVANAEILVQLHGQDYMWAREWESWLQFNCHHWRPNSSLELLKSAEDVSRELLRRQMATPRPPDSQKDEQKRWDAATKWAIASGDDKRVSSIERFARRRMHRSASAFDPDPYALCCENGVLDLRTGDLRDGQRSDLITRTTGIAYDADAKCPTFERFLDDVMQGDREMVEYLWRAIGYSLTGDTSERAFFLFCGDGKNGKSTFVETLKALLGPPGIGYAQKARFSTFLKKGQVGTGANDDVAHLAGARVVVASEADESLPLDVSLVKELTGGDTHRARHLYGREFEFKPQFKLWLVTNKVPPIRETAYAIWDRLHYVEFLWRVPEEKIDRALGLKLLGELPGILAKSVEYCLKWQKTGLCPPERVLKAGEKLFSEMDMVGNFINDCCEMNPDAKTSHKELYATFTNWAKASGIHRPPSSRWLAGELRLKQLTSERLTQNVMYWIGIELRTVLGPGNS